MVSAAERLEVASFSTGVLVLLLVVWTLLGTSAKSTVLPPSAIAALMGLVTAIAILTFQHYLDHGVVHRLLVFDSSAFLVYLLPPVIFHAGLAAHKKLFFSNLATILCMGIVGTVASFLIITAFLSVLTVSNILEFQDCLALGAIFSATDSVATLQALDPGVFPLLFAVVSGEGVINDATSVVLLGAVARVFPPATSPPPPPPSPPGVPPAPYSPLPIPDPVAAPSNVSSSSNSSFSPLYNSTDSRAGGDLRHMALRLALAGGDSGGASPSSSHSSHELGLLGNFLYLYSTSTVLGLATGVLIAFLLRYVQSMGAHREICLVGMLSYLSYLASEYFGLSGILCLFCCGITVSQWALPGMSPRGCAATIDAFHALSHQAEGIIFMYLGMDALDPLKWRATFPGEVVPLSLSLLLLLMFSRAVGVVPLALLHNFWGSQPMTKRDLAIIWWSGLQRGAVSVALVYYYFDAGTDLDGHKATIITSTLVTVLFTTLFFGLLTKPFLSALLDEQPDHPLVKLLSHRLNKLMKAIPMPWQQQPGYQAVPLSQTGAGSQGSYAPSTTGHPVELVVVGQYPPHSPTMPVLRASSSEASLGRRGVDVSGMAGADHGSGSGGGMRAVGSRIGALADVAVGGHNSHNSE